MTDRLTPQWTETLDEAFGASGTKGRLGEEFLAEVFDSWGWEYTWHQDDRALQVKGIDFTFRKPSWYNSYTCDVKANMDKYGSFYVYKDWLFKGESDRIFHVNPDTGWLCWYDRKEMQKWFRKDLDRAFHRLEHTGATLVDYHRTKITAKQRPEFITTRKHTK